MKGRIASLFGASALYALSNLLQRGLTFLLLPLYARHFTTAEFGAMDLLYQLVLVAGIVTSFGLPQGLVRGFYLDGDGSEQERRRIVGAMAAFLIPFSLAFSGLLLVAADPVARILFAGEGRALWVRLAALFYLVASFQQLPLQLMKTTGQARRYAAWSIASFALVATANVVLIVGLGWGLTGMIVANIVGIGATAIVLSWGFFRSLDWNLGLRRLSPLLAFGLPMLPALLARKVLEVLDRYMIPQYHGLDELGVYVMGARVAGILDVVVLVPFLYAWQPFFYAQAKNSEAPRLFARVTHYMLILLLGVFLAVDAAREGILAFLGGGKFEGAGPVVPILVLAVVLNGLQYCVSTGVHLERKLTQEMLVMLAAAVLNLVLNLVLIPGHKGMGAAIATAASYLFYLAGTFVLAQRAYQVPYLWGRMAVVAACAAAAAASLHATESVWMRLAAPAGFVAAVLALDLARHGEIGALRALVGARLRGRRVASDSARSTATDPKLGTAPAGHAAGRDPDPFPSERSER